MKVGVYVGSFNPVHKGHEKIVNYLLSNKFLDKVIVIPTDNYWDKQNLLERSVRINMLNKVFKGEVEIDSSLFIYPYTYQIMRELRVKYDNLYLIIGADNIVNFDKWKNVDEILNNYVLVLNRNDIDVKKYVNKFKRQGKFIILDKYPYLDISSTYIRNMIKEKKYNRVKDYLNKDVLNYIKENELYL